MARNGRKMSKRRLAAWRDGIQALECKLEIYHHESIELHREHADGTQKMLDVLDEMGREFLGPHLFLVKDKDSE